MSRIVLKNLLKSLTFYQELLSDFPEIKNNTEIWLDYVIGRMPRRLVFNYQKAFYRIEASGYVPLLYIYNEIFKERCYVPSLWEYANCFGPGKVVVDIGANVGLFTILAASYGSKVISIEPNPINYFFLIMNLEKNKLSSTTPVNLAISHQPGLVELFVAEQPSGSSAYAHQAIGNEFAVYVNSTTIDQLLCERNVDHVDFLKVDCEGSEYEILLQLNKKFYDKIHRIALEYHRGVEDYSPEQLVNFLQRFYRNVEVRGKNDETTGFIYASRE